MTVATLPGNVRFRAYQLGKQSTFGTPVAATRRMPWRFTPTVDPHWTSPDVDTGTLDPALAPYRTAIDVTGQSTGPLDADSVVTLWSAFGKGGVTPTGPVDGAYTWQYDLASTTSDPLELFTGEWGDEVVGDQWQYQDGLLDQLQLSYPQDLGPIAHTGDWRYGSATYPIAGGMTAGLSVAKDPPWLYGADTQLTIDDVYGSMGITPLVNSMHDASIQLQNNLDVKRFSNGSNVNFAVSGYGRGARMLQITITFAKSVAGLAEAAKWLNANPQERFISLNTTTRKLIGATSTYQQRIRFAGYWFTRSESEIGSNTGIQLVGNHIVDTNLSHGPIDVRVINARSAL